ncbi:hypothetical protein ACTFIT_003164 [Dictyostelium discoideum]
MTINVLTNNLLANHNIDKLKAMSTDNFEKIKGRPTQKEEWQLKEWEKEKDENNRLFQEQKQKTTNRKESATSLTPATFDKKEKDKRNIVRISLGSIFKSKDIHLLFCTSLTNIACKFQIPHYNIQLRCHEIHASTEHNLGKNHPIVSGFDAFIVKLDYFINCLANDNYGKVEIFRFEDYEELIQSFKSGYMDLSVHFISMNKDQIKMNPIPLNPQSPSASPPIGVETVKLLENNKIFIINGNQIDFGIDDYETNLNYTKCIYQQPSIPLIILDLDINKI